MRVAAFAINGHVRRLPQPLVGLADTKPNMAYLKGRKATDAQSPWPTIEPTGCHAGFREELRRNGVVILPRTSSSVTRTALPGDPADAQSRYIEAEMQGVLIDHLVVSPTLNITAAAVNWDVRGQSGVSNASLALVNVQE